MLSNNAKRVDIQGMNMWYLFAAVEPVATGKLLVDWNTILLSFIALIGTLGGGVLTYLTVKANANEKKQKEVAETLKEVKVDVNSGKTKMEEKIKQMDEALLAITAREATAQEKIRSEQDKAVALAATKVAPTEAKEP